MAMTLRPTADERDALRRRAEIEGRSMHEVARAAVREYVDEHDRADQVDAAAAWVTTNFRQALDRLRRA